MQPKHVCGSNIHADQKPTPCRTISFPSSRKLRERGAPEKVTSAHARTTPDSTLGAREISDPGERCFNADHHDGDWVEKKKKKKKKKKR